MKNPKDQCKNCKHLGEDAPYNEDPSICYHCRGPEYLYWEEVKP